MDLTALKGLGPARKEKLSAAGIEAIGDLEGEDADELADQVDIPGATLADFIEQAEGIGELERVEGLSGDDLAALVDAGVRDVDDLRNEDAEDIAAAAGLDADRVRGWQDSQPREAVEETLEEAEPETPEPVASAERIQEEALEASEDVARKLGEARVVLEEGITDARVKFEDEVLAQARIIPLKAKEDAGEFLDDVQGNVVVLQEAADDALVRVEGQLEEGLPVFKRSVAEARDSAEAGAREVRVKVQEIRDEELVPRAEELKAKVKDLLGLD